MIIKLLLFIKKHFVKFSFLFLIFLYSNSYSQCAGTDATLTICDIQNPVQKNINLFSLLGGNPTAGGTWIDNSKPLEESIFDGMLDAQTLLNSESYTYTYVQDPSVCNDNEATITIIIGPYTGVPSPNVSACNDMTSFNLFAAFDGTKLAPLQNGFWTANTTPLSLSGNTINPSTLGVGTYSYTYTIPALGGCPQQSATVSVSVFRKPISGDSSKLIVCSTDNLSAYTNLNLTNYLQGQDAGGRWTENKTITNELTSLNDNRINVQNIYNTLGAGTYDFTYTVLSNNPICTDSQSTVQIIIDKPLDFTGSTLLVNSDICETEIATARYKANLTKESQAILDGNYDVTYSIFDGTTTKSFSVNNDFVNGNFVFDIDAANLQAVGNYIFTITNIVYKDGYGVCTNILGAISDVLTIAALPRINNATVKIDPICKGVAAPVEISGDTNLTNGEYRITYNLSGDNAAANQQLNFTVNNGVGIFEIPANLLANVGVNTVFSITNITNLTVGCSNTASVSKAFTVKALPNVSGVTLSIAPICLNQELSVQLSGLGGLNTIVVNYSVSGANILLNQNSSIAVNAGNASFIIPAAVFVNSGDTTFTLNSVLDNSNACTSVTVNKTQKFLVRPIPSNPPTNTFVFCKNDLSTIGSLSPNGSQYQWFDSVSSTVVLSTTTLLVSGTYYVKEFNAIGCESGRTAVTVTVNEFEPPTLETDGQVFCGLDNPTIQNLTDKTIASGILYWFDARQNGNQYTASTLLQEGVIYYGYNFSTLTNCYSDPLEVTVSLSNCNFNPDDFFVPDGFSPNGDGVNDTFKIPNIEFVYPNFSLEIFNRYGNILFRGNRSKPEWDGKNSDYKTGIDGLAPNGVYFYILNLNKENKKPIQGRLYLNR